MVIRRGSLSAALEPESIEKNAWSFAGQPARHLPVFLHGGWRCGSTYIWSRFRQSPHTLCFYEPFHEILARCSAKKIHRDTSSSWNSRHPALARPYREEYLPLLGLRGARGYRDEFALAHYFPSPTALKPQLRYLSGLLNHAELVGKSAVLGFSRSLARVGTIKQALGGYHVVIRRNPLQQWLSCRSYRVEENSRYFELCHFMILALAPADSVAGRFARTLGLPRPPPGRFREQYDFLNEALWPWSDELSYGAFLAVTLLSHAIAAAHADLTIDLNHLSVDPKYQDALRTTIFARTGLSVDFQDCRVGKHETASAAIDFEAVELDVVRALRSCDAPLLAAQSAHLKGSTRAGSTRASGLARRI